MLTLYNFAQSTCSQKVRLTLAEKGLDFEDRQIDLKKNENLADWYLEINPNGVVPALVHDGKAVVDSSIINEYIDEVFPEPSLVPSDPHTRARMRAWRQFIDEIPTAAIRVPSFNAYIVPNWGAASGNKTWASERLAKAKQRISFYRRLTDEGFPPEEVEDARTKLRVTVERMDKSLADGPNDNPWLIGEQFTLADIALIPTFVRMEDLGITEIFEDLPRVVDWFARSCARPSFARAYYEGSRMIPKTRAAE